MAAVEAVLAEPVDARVPGRPIRVLQLITSLERGGAENHLFALLTHADRQAFELETAVISGEGELVPIFREAGIPVHLLKARSRLDPLALARLVRLLRRGHFDIVHSHLFRADIYAGLAVGRLGDHRPLLVSTRHNDDRFFLNPFVGLVHYGVSARQDLIIAISDHIARFTVSRGVRHPGTRQAHLRGQFNSVGRIWHPIEPCAPVRAPATTGAACECYPKCSASPAPDRGTRRYLRRLTATVPRRPRDPPGSRPAAGIHAP